MSESIALATYNNIRRNIKNDLADAIEREWENVWSGEGLDEFQIVDRITNFIKGEK